MTARPTSADAHSPQTRGVITLGFGSGRYCRMAAALARSTRLHNPDLPLAVITDHPDGSDPTAPAVVETGARPSR